MAMLRDKFMIAFIDSFILLHLWYLSTPDYQIILSDFVKNILKIRFPALKPLLLFLNTSVPIKLQCFHILLHKYFQ